jgi:hypothetical protein
MAKASMGVMGYEKAPRSPRVVVLEEFTSDSVSRRSMAISMVRLMSYFDDPCLSDAV